MGKRTEHPIEWKDELLAEQGGLCWVCGRPCGWQEWSNAKDLRQYPTFEHKRQLRLGGDDTRENLAVSHLGCNQDRERPNHES